MHAEFNADQNGRPPSTECEDRGQALNSAGLITQRGKRRQDKRARGQSCPRVSLLVDAEALAIRADQSPDWGTKVVCLVIARVLVNLATRED